MENKNHYIVSIEIKVSKDTFFNFFTDLKNWKKWDSGIVNVEKEKDNVWLLHYKNTSKPNKVTMNACPKAGILDHKYFDAEKNIEWNAFVRVVTICENCCVFSMTFIKPKTLDTEKFLKDIKNFDMYLLGLKKIVEESK